MAYFEFFSRETGEPVSIASVDEAIRAYLGMDPDPDYCCGGYDAVVDTGFGLLLNKGGDRVTPQAMDAYLHERLEGHISAKTYRLLRWAHLMQWEMHAWR